MITQVDEIAINYDWIDPDTQRSETLLVFLHEALGSIGQWKNFPKLLCESLGVRGLVYERQGHGQSSGLNEERTASYLHDYALIELPAFLKSLKIDQPIVLVGHSDGGSIALLYAHKFPTNVKAVITMAAHVINEPETIAGISPAIEAWNAGKLNGLRKYHGENTENIFWAWANIWRDESFKSWNITNEIGSDAPHFCIQGKDDQYGTKRQLDLLEKHVHGTMEMIDKCGHHPHLERQNYVLRRILDWMKETNIS